MFILTLEIHFEIGNVLNYVLLIHVYCDLFDNTCLTTLNDCYTRRLVDFISCHSLQSSAVEKVRDSVWVSVGSHRAMTSWTCSIYVTLLPPSATTYAL